MTLFRQLTAAAASALLLFSTPGFAQVAQSDLVTEAPEAAPAMWRVSDDDSTLYLFGTLHVLPDSETWLNEGIRAAMAETPVTVFEADTTGPAAEAELVRLIQTHGLNPQGVKLSDLLGAKRWRAFSKEARGLGFQPAMFEQQRPWLALLTLTTTALTKAGFNSEAGAEQVITDIAKTEGDTFEYLESLEDQILTLASLDDGAMLENFDASLLELGKLGAITQEMLEKWRTGDTAGLRALVLDELKTDAPAAYASLIVVRNERWRTIIGGILDGAGDHFIAVGAGHLIGDDSVVEMLRTDGFLVERVQ